MNFKEMEKASDFFNPVNFTRFFEDKLKRKKGGGLDGLTPATFWKHYSYLLLVDYQYYTL